MTLATRFLRVHWMLCLTLTAAIGLVVLAGGCPRPSGNSNGQGDNGDGTADGGGDVDGDGTPNAQDADVDGDGTPNAQDADVDGDGTPNAQDPDIDGDGTDNADDNSANGADGNGDGTTDGGDGNSDGTTDGGDGNNDGTGNGDTSPPAPTSVALSVLAKSGDAVPGQPSGVTFAAFGDPVLDAKGRVAFWGFYAGSGAKGHGGLYVHDGSTVAKVFDDDPNSAGIVPGRSSPHYFEYDPNGPDIAWGAGDRLLFCARIVPASGGTAYVTGVYRWRATDGDLVRVADRDQVADTFPDVSGAGTGNPTFQGAFFRPAVSDNGLASFGVHYTYVRDPNTASGLDVFVRDKNAVFTSNGTTVTKIADDNTEKAGIVPDYPADGYFSAVVAATTMSGPGDMLFQGTYTSGSSVWRGVYMVRSGVAYRVIDNRTGAAWPGLPSGARFLARDPSLDYALAIGPAGRIGLAGRLAVGGATDSAVILWDWDTDTWAELTGSGGAPATALLSGVNDDGAAVILSGGNPNLASGSGQTRLNATLPADLQGATLVWLDSGGAISNYGRAALPYTNSGKDGLALWTSEQLLVVADAQLGTPANLGEIHTIAGPEQDRPGRSGLLNDDDAVTFRAVLSNATEAIYLAQGQ